METPKTFHIPEINLPYLKERIGKLNKRAQRLGCHPITITIINRYERTDSPPESLKEEVTPMVVLSIEGASPKLNGWSFLGTIEHTEHGNLLRVVKDIELDESYRTQIKQCDHCQQDRTRKDTYLVIHDDGSIKQLGKTCLKDYCGHVTPEYLAQLASFIKTLEDCDEDEISSWGSSRTVREVNPLTFLRWCCEAVVEFGGFSPRSAPGVSTAGHAWHQIFPPPPIKGQAQHVKLYRTKQGEELCNKVVEMIESWDGQEHLDQFHHNILLTWKMETIEYKHTGILAAATYVYKKELVKHLEKQSQLESKHVGEVGTRTEFVVHLYKQINVETAWGTMTITIMKDLDGNILVWKGKGFYSCDAEVGDKIKVKATVKKHDVYKGVNQTLVNRCSLVEKVSQMELSDQAQA